ncbi:MAG TPA: S8 family peptidase [Fimbriimonas sp.]
MAAPATEIHPIRLDGVLCHPRNLFVQASDAGSRRLVESSGAAVLRTFPEIGAMLVQVPADSLGSTKSRLEKVFGSDRVEVDRAGRVAYTPNDTEWPNMWHPKAIKADTAWDLSLGSDSAVVAILDTGVNVAHPDLSANAWSNAGEIAGNGLDDDGNGYVDDVNGFDFAYNDNDPDDVHGHGTACAGLAAAVGDNAAGVIGVAPRARIMALKVANDSGYFYASATVPAYLYGAKMGARVYSMSYYADGVSRTERSALQWAAQQGVLPFAAAGNDATVYPFYPAVYEFVVAVAALNTDLSKAWFSDWGSWVDVSAPGVALWTTTNGGGYTSSFAGTSGACPVAAGVAALLFGANPAATPARVRNAILETATLQDQAPFGEFTNYGMVNARSALRYLSHPSLFTTKSTKVRWISPIGSAPAGTNVRARVYGRNLQNATASVGGVAATRIAASKDWFDYQLPSTGGKTAIASDGATYVSTAPPVSTGYVYPLIEASAKGSSVTGGYFESLRQDGTHLICNRRGDGFIYFEGVFKNLPASGRHFLTLDRYYSSTTTGTERIELYDWRSGSYPYGSFVTLYEGPVPTTSSRVVLPIREIAKHVDFERNAYLRIVTSNDLGAGAALNIDRAFIRP